MAALEHCILTGKIVARQRHPGTREGNYVSEGKTLDYEKVRAIAKVAPTGQLVIITVYLV